MNNTRFYFVSQKHLEAEVVFELGLHVPKGRNKFVGVML